MKPASARAASQLAIRGDLLDFSADPGSSVHTGDAVRYEPDGWLLVSDGVIQDLLPANFQPGPDWLPIDHRGNLITPGLIDSHVHSGQSDVIASYGADLLEWLERYTFPNEARFADEAYAEQEANVFCDALLANGTTTAAVFPTSHSASVDALFNAAHARDMKLIAGKVLMNRHCPDNLSDPPDDGESISKALIKRWHGFGRLHYAITPRFAPTSTESQLAMAGRLLQDCDDLYMQTHVAENREEVAWVAKLFPSDASYLSTYARHGLLGPRSILGHGIWLDDQDRAMLADSGAAIAFCPSSNLFLGSGLLDIDACDKQRLSIAMASDIGGGPRLSMLATMADACKVMALRSHKLTAFRAFYFCTLAGARALRLDQDIGSFRPRRSADLTVLRWADNPLIGDRSQHPRSIHERLFKLMILGGEQDVVATYIRGKRWCGSN